MLAPGRTLRRKGARTVKTTRVKRSVETIRRSELIARRKQCMAQIAQLRSDAVGSENFSQKAHQLLTKYWSTSSWRSKADILRTAEWLIAAARKNTRLPA